MKPRCSTVCLGAFTSLWFFIIALGSAVPGQAVDSGPFAFNPEVQLGRRSNNPSTPFLRLAPDGRLFAVWTEDDKRPMAMTKQEIAAPPHESHMKMTASPMRIALLAWSKDGSKTWTSPRQVNSAVEAIEGEEGGPRLAFGKNNRAYVVWSVPNEKGDKTRANIRFAVEDGKGGFTPAKTLNELKNTARFPIIETMADDSLLVGWIDRRVDNPIPRSLYLKRLSAKGDELTGSYKIGGGLCECCRLGIAFADGGKTVYVADRQVSEQQIRNHALRKSTDGGRHFAPPQLVQANTAPEILHTTLAVAADGTVYLAWENLDDQNKSQIFMRSLAPDGQTWSSIQQLSRTAGNASRPMLALSQKLLHVAWTETEGETSWISTRTAPVVK